MQGKFKKEDKEKVIEFLNRIAKHAKFDGMNTTDIIEFYKSLAFMQSVLLPKIESNILEVVQVVTPEKTEE